MTQLIAERRKQRLGENVRAFYHQPVHIVRGKGVRLWDKEGCEYLDCYNNVPVVGHCNPKIVEAITRQASMLNTHTRYFHEAILDYLDMLLETFKASFTHGLLTCSGSEANDVALRMAWAATGKKGIIATDHTYHGNSFLVSQLSKNKTPIGGHADFIRFVPAPDSYRPLGEKAGMAHAQAFAGEVKEAIADLQRSSHGIAVIILCPFFANEGFPELEKNWLDPAIDAIRMAGGVIIADEVQSGFGRTGDAFWAHERMGFVPDIVTMGKPMGNGHPVAGLVTSEKIMNHFRRSYGYFNTFGGNPVSVAAARATLECLLSENLTEHARNVGNYAKARMNDLYQKFDCIGDVRGAGLFFGAEFVQDRDSKKADHARADRIVNAMRHQGVLMNFLGIHYNTLKIRPPLPFSNSDADELFEKLEGALSKDIDQYG